MHRRFFLADGLARIHPRDTVAASEGGQGVRGSDGVGLFCLDGARSRMRWPPAGSHRVMGDDIQSMYDLGINPVFDEETSDARPADP